MFFKQSEHSYKVKLPESTSNDVVEWFETMSANNKLSTELIALVYNSLRSNVPEIHFDSSPKIANKNCESTINKEESQDEFFNSLYNWQDSCNAVFKDEKFQEQKKGMLFV